ncbi:S46 family peptidase [Bacteroides uniformis]|uniref:Dipeptidyl-peptidase n=1 Tax=Bacteroides uniformis TaxID=820 RepID=A0A6I0LK42_BACUN|nr:S46 family peptidase [Bacteroides uniformis]KAB4249950.1 S46 family peptidase [Bacteroides uniformis]KAB4253102.1 S46 family peptidase [Bacteroides uniformis]KAB4253377.1 S46 family peptidase [Bacteroides uniformis]KAB4260595.1 S46 family peptidase [Bacteroides uniformis]
MKITFKKGLLAAIAALTVCSARADEGMWLLQLMKQQNSIDMMKKQGLKLEADDLYNPNGVSLKDAVGIFGGGCTGEIISPEGLILTNHHCGYGAIQQHSSVEHDYLTDGFWAMNRSEELPTPGLKFRFVHRIVDITDLVNAKIKAGEVTEIDALTSPFLSKLAKEELEKSDLKGKPGIEVRALPFYAGNKFYMFYYKVYSDVRMVAAPPSSVGKFGGETDNWMWPRHTGDFSMFRIYADANGEPAEYSESNVPLKTPKFLPISIKGLNEGDYAMIMGFPGSTERYLTQSEVKQRMNAVNQAMIDMRGVRLEVLRKYMDASDKTRIQYASKFAGSSNYWKNSIGMNKAIIDNDVLGAKAEIEKKYASFAQGKPEYEGVVEKIDAIIEKSTPTLRQLYYTNEALRGAIEFGSTYLIMDNIKKALEEKNDSLLQASKKQLENAYDGIHNKDYDHEVDRAVAKAILPALAKALNADELPSFYQTINGEFKGDYNAYVDNIYDNSILSNRKNLDKSLAKPTVKAIEKDPATAYSRSKNEKLQELGKQYMELESGMELLHKAYIRGLGEMKQPVPSYPDANFTMRLTYGNVKSYSPRDAVHYDYYTTTDGILEKENPEDREFVVPAKLKELIQKKDFGRYAMADGTMPVCFLTTNDITGGNSGSPVINGEGQLIGTAFDGNWESLSGDINFNNDLQRCIALDIRYVLFILDKLGNCSHLIKEMNIIE